MDTRVASSEVRRILDRYLVEVVEAFHLCPWARSARNAEDMAVDIVWGEPDASTFADAAVRALPGRRVAMIIAPDSTLDPAALRRIRDDVAERIPTAGVADFHPDAALDLSTPARLVPFLRRSPDRMLQLVPLAILDQVRAPPSVADRARQIAILRGAEAPVDVAASLAASNHATVTARAAEITAILDDIAADRARSYASASR